LHHNLPKSEVLAWYQRASLYWHAAGFEVAEASNPEKVEHFGISTAEAMAMGCVPIVVGKGGQLEVVGSELKALTWQTVDECVATTAKLIASPTQYRHWQTVAVEQVRQFGPTSFAATLAEMIMAS
jgi:glycosyltransferase involved in cell wall biosynthesis